MLHRTGTFFPEGCGSEATEVGPRTDYAGPCLVVLKGVSKSRAKFEAWLRDSVIEWAVMRVYWVTHRCSSREELVKELATVSVPQGRVRLQCYPRKLEQWLAEELPLSWDLQPVDHMHVLDVVETEAGLAWCLAPTQTMFRMTAFTRPRLEGPLCKATSKLAEALAWLKHEPHGGVAIDLGASPGGWSSLLAASMSHVVSVDPADMSPAALALPNLTHVRAKAEEAVPAIQRALAPWGGRADLLVSDMNKHPAAMVKMVAPLLPLLRPGGKLVLTLKFFSRSRDKVWDPRTCPELAGFQGIEVVWLLANTAHERTCLACKGPDESHQHAGPCKPQSPSGTSKNGLEVP